MDQREKVKVDGQEITCIARGGGLWDAEIRKAHANLLGHYSEDALKHVIAQQLKTEAKNVSLWLPEDRHDWTSVRRGEARYRAEEPDRVASARFFIKKNYKKNRISKWSQSESFRGDLDVGGGICRGMCYDWVRLVLHDHAKSMHTSRLGFGEDKRLRMQAEAHDLLNSASRGTREKFNAAFEERDHALDARRAKEAQAQWEAMKEEGYYERQSYETFQREWVSKFSKQAAKEGSYDDIEMTAERQDLTSLPSAEDVWGKLLGARVRGLGDNRCGIFQFNYDRWSGAGHAMAFWCINGAYHVLEPNIGWYCFHEASGVEKFFVDVWRGMYQSRGVYVASWLVFCKKSATP